MKAKIYIFMALFLVVIFSTQKVNATVHQVQVGNFFFNPASLNVTVGDTVKWVWASGSHTTTSSTIPAGAASWDHLITSSNTTYSYTVTVAGTYDYVCTPHVTMGMVASFVATNPSSTLSVAPSSQNVAQTAGSVNFSVTSNASWTCISNQTWCTVTPSGTGNGTISATYTANSTGIQRSAMTTVSVSGLPDEMVTVNQDAALGINDPAAETITLFPNPVRSKLTILSESLKTSEEEVNIYNINSLRVLGPVTISGSPAFIDLSTLPEGVYFIRIGRDGSGKVQKIIKTL